MINFAIVPEETKIPEVQENKCVNSVKNNKIAYLKTLETCYF